MKTKEENKEVESLVFKIQSKISELQEKLKSEGETGRVVIVGVDASDCSKDAVKEACSKKLITKGDICVLTNVWEKDGLDYLMLRGLSTACQLRKQMNELRIHNEQALFEAETLIIDFYSEILSGYNVLPLVIASHSLSKSCVGSILCTVGKLLKTDYIILGGQGHSLLHKVFAGSVTKYVVDNARNTTVIVCKK